MPPVNPFHCEAKWQPGSQKSESRMSICWCVCLQKLCRTSVYTWLQWFSPMQGSVSQLQQWDTFTLDVQNLFPLLSAWDKEMFLPFFMCFATWKRLAGLHLSWNTFICCFFPPYFEIMPNFTTHDTLWPTMVRWQICDGCSRSVHASRSTLWLCIFKNVY